MTDLERGYRPQRARRTHLDDDSSSNEPPRDPLALPSLIIPLNGTIGKKASVDGPPPDGGLQAWLQVLGSFFLFFNSW